jgi:hypothetical protein
MGGACGTYGDRRCAQRVLVGKPEGNKPFVSPRNNLEESNKMDLREVGWEIMD